MTKTGSAIVWACILLWSISLTTPARADSIEVSLDRQEISLGEEAILQIKIEGSNAQEPRLLDMPGVHIAQHGKSSQIQIINGHMQKNVIYSYSISPENTGHITIAPIQVVINHKTYQSDPLQLNVVATQQNPSQDKEAFIEVTLTSQNAFVGQQIIYTFRFFRRVQVLNAAVNLPNFDHLMVESLGEQHDYETVINQQPYSVTEIRKALFPQAAESYTIPGVHMEFDTVTQQSGRQRMQPSLGNPFDMLMGREKRQHMRLQSEPIVLHVDALKNSPLVGTWQLDVNFSKEHLKIGESTTQTIQIRGNGNIHHVLEPNIHIPASFKQYSDKAATTSKIENQYIVFEKVFKKALIPTQAGQFHIEPVVLHYFDPEKKTYHSIQSKPCTLSVEEDKTLVQSQPPPYTPQPTASKTDTKQDIVVISDDTDTIFRDETTALRNNKYRGYLWRLGFISPSLLLGLVAWKKHKQRYISKKPNLKKIKMHISAKWTQLSHLIDTGDTKQAVTLASQLLKEYLSQLFMQDMYACTPQEIFSTLIAHHVPQHIVDKIANWQAQCEAMLYASDNTTATNQQWLINELSILMQLLEEHGTTT